MIILSDFNDYHLYLQYHCRGLVYLCNVDSKNKCKPIAIVDTPTEHPWERNLLEQCQDDGEVQDLGDVGEDDDHDHDGDGDDADHHDDSDDDDD